MALGGHDTSDERNLHACGGRRRASSADLTVQVGEIRDLFTAPDTDPLAQHEGEVMGEPALRASREG